MGEKNKIISRIHLNNGHLTFEKRDGETGWYRNGKPVDIKTYKFYDESLGAYRTLLGSGDTKVYTPYLDKLKFDDRSSHPSMQGQTFKFGEKHITLRTKGNMNLATIPYNMLDSIAINTGRSNTGIKDNLGLIGKESTFGGYSIPIMNAFIKKHPEYSIGRNIDENGKYNPVGSNIYAYDLVNNHAYFTNKYSDYNSAIIRKMPIDQNADKRTTDKVLVKRENMAKDAYENNRFRDNTTHYHENVLADAFARYAANPAKYNPGQKNYVQMVNNIGNEVWNEPQIQLWWNTEGNEYYKKGLSEKRRLESAGKKSK